jgi:hypothetical protein
LGSSMMVMLLLSAGCKCFSISLQMLQQCFIITSTHDLLNASASMH